jgi:excisionase family DNA binding protein
MAVTFTDEIHPKKKMRIKFQYDFRATQYLEYFNIIDRKTHKFLPLDLTFQSYDELVQYLYDKGIVYTEFVIAQVYPEKDRTFTVVNARKIYELDEDISNYLFNYKYYSINEVAKMLSFSRTTIYKIIRSGKLQSNRVNGQERIKHSDLVNYINSSTEELG